MWKDVERGFQVAFEAAWSAYQAGTIPIGASCILNEHEEVVVVSRNQIFAGGAGLISFHQLAHAEINAILQISEMTTPNLHANIRQYTLYTTMEPCPLCFGAIVMGSIRFVKYAARDRWAGAVALNEALGYIQRKRISVEGPFAEGEIVQIAMQVCMDLARENPAEFVIDCFNEDCPEGVAIGRRLRKSGALERLAKQGVDIAEVYDFILNMKEA